MRAKFNRSAREPLQRLASLNEKATPIAGFVTCLPEFRDGTGQCSYRGYPKMMRVAVFIRFGHLLDEDFCAAMDHLRAAGIRATEGMPDATEWSRRFIWIQKDEEVDVATTVLRGAGIRCC
jgi:hypothetical protein